MTSKQVESINEQLLEMAISMRLEREEEQARQKADKLAQQERYYKMNVALWTAKVNGLKTLADEQPEFADDVAAELKYCYSWLTHYDCLQKGIDEPEDNE